MTDESGQVVRRHDYFPFGEESNAQPGGDARRFTGKERDAETAFDYFGARYYRNVWGRFTTVDPGHVGGNVFDPQSWNAYAYARNNPLRFTDPTGTDYEINIDGGQVFWFVGGPSNEFGQLQAWAAGYDFRGGMWGGTIYNAAGTSVGTYTYADKIVHLASDITGRTSGVVDAVGQVVTIAEFALAIAYPVLSTAANCVVRNCSAGSAAMAALPLAGRLRFTTATASRMGQAGRQVPVQILAQAIRNGTRMPDPQNAPGAVKVVQEIFVNGSRRTLTIIYREADNTILHFHYQ